VTTQAVSLGLLPRCASSIIRGACGANLRADMNWILWCRARVGDGFRQLRRIAGAYGLAVSGAMTIVTPLTLSLIKSADRPGEPSTAHGPVPAVHRRHRLPVANLTKLEEGGWLPLTSGLFCATGVA